MTEAAMQSAEPDRQEWYNVSLPNTLTVEQPLSVCPGTLDLPIRGQPAMLSEPQPTELEAFYIHLLFAVNIHDTICGNPSH